MKVKAILKLSLMVVSFSLIIFGGIYGTGCSNKDEIISWVFPWSSDENLRGLADSDYDIFLARSTDSGTTWSAVQTLNSDANTDSGDEWGPRAITDGNGNWVAVWGSDENPDDTDGTDEDIFVSFSTDDGETWSTVQTLNTNVDTAEF